MNNTMKDKKAMSGSPKAKVIGKISEDRVKYFTVSGKEVCSVYRDEDSETAATKVFEALNVEVVLEDEL